VFQKYLLLISVTITLWSGDVLLDEHFHSLSAWEGVKFEKIDRTSSYTPSSSGLILESNDAASALRLKGRYDPKLYPIIEVEWKASVCEMKGDATQKSGDDAPLRLYVAWEYDPSQSDWLEKMLYGVLKLFYGEYPPKAVLNYIMSSQAMKMQSFVSPYTDKVKIIPLDSCEKSLGEWKKHQIDVMKDYQTMFGKAPSGQATLGLMTDSDNTHGRTLAAIGSILIRSGMIKE